MRKLLVVIVVFATFWISTASYAASDAFYLIYKMSTSVKGIDSTTALPMSVSLKGYIVLAYDWHADGYDFNDVAFIMCGQNIIKQKVYVNLTYNDGDGLIDYENWSQGGGYEFFDFPASSPFEFDCLMFGKEKVVDVGGGKVLIDCVSSMKGVFWAKGGMLLDQSRDIAGTGNISASLLLPTTKTINNAIDPEWMLDLVMKDLLKSYTKVTIQ